MGWTVQGSNPSGGEILRTCPYRSWGPPSLLYNGYWVFPGGKKQLGCDADSSPPSSAEVYKQSRAIPLLSIRAFVACKKGETYLPSVVSKVTRLKAGWQWNLGLIPSRRKSFSLLQCTETGCEAHQASC
jgi:hypothetical protein